MPTATTTYQMSSTGFTTVELPVLTLILSAVVLIFVSIILTVLVMYENRSNKGCNKTQSCDNRKGTSVKDKCPVLIRKDFNHLLILVAVILIFFFTNLLIGDTTAFDYISFASTITSIVLSVIAIFMTISSESKSEGVKASIDDSVKQITSATDGIKEYIELMNKYEQKSSSTMQAVDNSIEKLESILSSINTYTDQMGAYGEKINTISKRTENIENKFNRGIRVQNIKSNAFAESSFSDQNIDPDEVNAE